MTVRRLNLYSFSISRCPVRRPTTAGNAEAVVVEQPTPELSAVIERETLKSRFLRGNVCACLLRPEGKSRPSRTAGSRAVSYLWIAFHEEWVGEIEMRIRPGPREAYLYDAFTLPHYRCRKFFSTLLNASLMYLTSRGCTRALIFALHKNKPSIRAIEKADFKYFQSILFLEFLGRKLHFPSRRIGGEAPVALHPQ